MPLGPRFIAAVPLALLLAVGCGSELDGRAPAPERDAEIAVTSDSAVEVTPDALGVPETPDAEDAADAEPLEAVADDASDVARDLAAAEVETDLGPAGPCDHLAEGQACDDLNACTLGDRCTAGRCLPTSALACDDGDLCTDDTCDALTGCVRRGNLAVCDDGDPCTSGDHCSAGRCRPGGPRCDDLNPCTRDSCGPGGVCTNAPDDDLPCEDASACTAGDFCAGGVCMAGLGDGCAVSDPCVSVACGADGLSCKVEVLGGMVCDDGDACTEGDRCQSGLCRPGLPTVCLWDSECAAFHCDKVAGCVLDTTYQAGKTCSDEDRCTVGETCDDVGVCASTVQVECDDQNPCTADSCRAPWGCEHTWVQAGCDDGSACTIDDQCAYGQCHGQPLGCEDLDLCTADSCDPLVGCQHLPVVCEDRNVCTTDSCEPASGCRYTPRAGSCDDGLACTVLDVCVAGVCQAGASTCGDGDPCTVDVCDAEEGCLHEPLLPCPVGALRVVAVGVNASPTGLGQWVAIGNDSAASFDLAGYAIFGERCDCEARIDTSVEVGLATVYGLRASRPAPEPGELAPGGRASADAFDFVFGVPGDGFYLDPTGDHVELLGPGGELVDRFELVP